MRGSARWGWLCCACIERHTLTRHCRRTAAASLCTAQREGRGAKAALRQACSDGRVWCAGAQAGEL